MNVVAHPGILSLFSGVEGLGLGVRRVLGGHRIVCHVEVDVFCAAGLAAEMRAGRLDEAPVWSNVRTFDCGPWRGRVDGVIAGWPCPPVSSAGKRLAQEDPRWLWPEVVRILREVQPRWFFGENVRGLLVAGHGTAFRDVLWGLADSGFTARWTTLRASDVGAPHRRERVFILAVRNGDGCEGGWTRERRKGTPTARDYELADPRRDESERRGGCGDLAGESGNPESEARQREWGGDATGGSGTTLAHPASPLPGRVAPTGLPTRGPGGVGVADASGRYEGESDGSESGDNEAEKSTGRVSELADSSTEGLQGRVRIGDNDEPELSAPERSGLQPFPPGPNGDWSRVPRELWPVTPSDEDRWRQALDEAKSRVGTEDKRVLQAETQSCFRRQLDGPAARLVRSERIDRLRAYGNAVVPAQAEAALRMLLKEVSLG